MGEHYYSINESSPSGRVGRAGRSGTAYSMICQDEMPFVFDLHLFLGRPVQFATPEHTKGRLLGMSALMLDTFKDD